LSFDVRLGAGRAASVFDVVEAARAAIALDVFEAGKAADVL